MLNPKKLLRSLIVFAPRLQGARFRAEARVVRILRRPYQPEFEGLRALALREPLVLDIGCNRGISIQSILAVRPDARVIGFEANAALAAETKRWFAPDRRVEVRPSGLGSRPGSIQIYVPRYRNYTFDGFGSFEPSGAERHVSDGWLYGFDPRHLHVDTVTVTIERLDDLNLAPAIIKLYVQGYELEVLEGAAGTLARHEPVILAPSGNLDVDTVLRSKGYRRFQWSEGRFEPEADFGLYVYYMTPARFAALAGAAGACH
jgi:FkbM family methyltransferase